MNGLLGFPGVVLSWLTECRVSKAPPHTVSASWPGRDTVPKGMRHHNNLTDQTLDRLGYWQQRNQISCLKLYFLKPCLLSIKIHSWQSNANYLWAGNISRWLCMQWCASVYVTQYVTHWSPQGPRAFWQKVPWIKVSGRAWMTGFASGVTVGPLSVQMTHSISASSN